MGDPLPQLQVNALRQFVTDGVAAVLDGNDAGTPAAGNDGDGLPDVAAQGKQEGVHLLIVRVDGADEIFLAGFGSLKGHKRSPDLSFKFD